MKQTVSRTHLKRNEPKHTKPLHGAIAISNRKRQQNSKVSVKVRYACRCSAARNLHCTA